MTVGALADVRRNGVARPQDADQSDSGARSLDDRLEHFGHGFDAGLFGRQSDGDDGARRTGLVRLRQRRHAADFGAGLVDFQLFGQSAASVSHYPPILGDVFHLQSKITTPG